MSQSDFLLVRAARTTCALPIAQVSEVMRPLRLERLKADLPFVLGVTTVRGAPAPVIDLAHVLTGEASDGVTRWVSLRLEPHAAVLAVSEVTEVRPLPDGLVRSLPPLLVGAKADAVAAVDERLLLFLSAGRVVPAEAFSELRRAP